MTAIEFNNISKQYRLGLVSTRTLSHDLNRWWKMNVRRQEDPYLKIGEVNDRASKGESDYVWALRDIDSYPTMKFIYREVQDGYFAELTYELQKEKINVIEDGIAVGKLVEKTNNIGQEKGTENVPENVPENRLEKIIKNIRQNNSITIHQLAEIQDVDIKTIKRDLNKLKQAGIITRMGAAKGGFWKLNNQK